MKWTVFVEGKSDRQFVGWLLGRLGAQHVEVEAIHGGVSKLANVANEIRRSHDRGRRIALLLDADASPRDRRAEVEGAIARLDLPIERRFLFLLPDDTNAGDLETLLEQIAPARHQALYGCLDDYAACVGKLDRNYTPPGQKARVYAYCEAVGARTGADRDYGAGEHGNPGAGALAPLRRFLSEMVAGAAPTAR